MFFKREKIFGMYLGQLMLVPKYLVSEGREIQEVQSISLQEEGYCISNDYEQLFSINSCRLILRKKEDMTDREMAVYKSLKTPCYNKECETDNCDGFDNPISLEYLITIGIDIFNVIEKGWAVKESEVKK